MLNFNIANNKIFMNMLLKENTFDNFEVREVLLTTFTNITINGILNKDYFTLEKQETIHNNYCYWSEIKPIVYNLVKGNKQPKYFKIIFSYDSNKLPEISENAKSLFLNIVFENNTITCITGSSEITFNFDKKVENTWDDYIKKFFSQININI